METKLGRIERVDLRSIWLKESVHFTPWLAEAENLALLGEALKIELELEAQEKQVGPFRADILCKDTANETWVLIENQIEQTDHTHLGQLLTYAAGLQAVSIVWVSTKFAEEHKNALDWLNSITNEAVRFFGVEVELWRINDSVAAPRFNVVCRPNDWGKAVQQGAASLAAASPTEQLRIRYWSEFRKHLQENKSRLRPQKPAPNHWYSFGIGTSLAHLSALLNTKEGKIEVELNITSDTAKAIYAGLLTRKPEIEASIGGELDWRELPESKTCRILLSNFVDPRDEKDWLQQFAWLQVTLEKFDQTFRPLFANQAFHRREEEI